MSIYTKNIKQVKLYYNFEFPRINRNFLDKIKNLQGFIQEQSTAKPPLSITKVCDITNGKKF